MLFAKWNQGTKYKSFIRLAITNNLLVTLINDFCRFLSFRFLQQSMIMQRATSKAAIRAAIITAISVLVKIAADWTATADGKNTAELLYFSLPSLIYKRVKCR